MSRSGASEGRLGVFVDGAFRHEGGRVCVSSETFGFLVFVDAVAESFSTLTFFGRQADADIDLVALPSERATLQPLPSYASLTDLPQVARGSARTAVSMWRGLRDVDVVWVFGPHPFALVLVVLALVRRRRVALGVRQDTMAYFRSRLPGPAWYPVLAPLALLDVAFRGLGRFLPVTAVGPAIARRYGAPRHNVMDMAVTLVRVEDATSTPRANVRGPTRLLSVGRVDSEKNPLLLVEVLAELERSDPGRYTLTWVGTGPMRDEMLRLARALGVADRLDLPGFVPYGPALLEHYRGADIFVHTAVTEGMPQVLYEAAAMGRPIVATDVGSVRSVMGDGEAALLVPPSDRGALVEAIGRLSDDPDLRRDLGEAAGRLGAIRTLDSESSRVATFLTRRRAGATETMTPAPSIPTTSEA